MRISLFCLLIALTLNATAGRAETVVQNRSERLEVSFDFNDAAGFIFFPVAGAPDAIIDVSSDDCCPSDSYRLDISISLDGGANIDDFLFVEGPMPPGFSAEFSQDDFMGGLGGAVLGLDVTALRISNSGSGWVASLVMAESGCNIIADFSGGTLDLQFDLATDVPATWQLGFFIAGTYTPLGDVPLPVVDPVISFSLSAPGFPDFGTIAILSILYTSTDIICLDVALVDTSP